MISGNTKVMIKAKIVEALIEVEIGNTEDLLIETLSSEIKLTDNKANSANTNEITIFESFKEEIAI